MGIESGKQQKLFASTVLLNKSGYIDLDSDCNFPENVSRLPVK